MKGLHLAPEPEESTALSPNPPWPELGEEALFGVAGRFVRAVESHTEADPAAVLFTLLSAAGNSIGRGSYIEVGADRHHAKINVVLVGETSKARKGMSWGLVRMVMQSADKEWAEQCVVNGLSSGEGLIQAVRDPVRGKDKKGEDVLLYAGAEDKRAFVIEQEFAGPLKMAAREGNTLSPVIRQAWDDVTLRVMTKNSPIKATESHVTIFGHITSDELPRNLNQTEAANGFANRHAWVLARRSKKLPFGGELGKVNMAPIVKQLKDGVEFGRQAGEIRWGYSARPVWEEAYDRLSEGEPGLFGAVTSRSEAQVLRLVLVYAALDTSQTIEEDHLRAALAAWKYAEDSARHVFGDATGDDTADTILRKLRDAGVKGMTRDDIYSIWKGRRSKPEVERALEFLRKSGRARMEKADTGGRPRECWFASGVKRA